MNGRVDAVILDIDGTLLLSNEAHARAFVEAAGQMGIDSPSVEEILNLIGKGGDKLIPEAFGFEADSEEGERLDELKGEIFREKFAPNLQPAPGARELLERFRSDGLRRVVATSANRDDLKILLERANVADLIDDATSSSDVENSKPDPDVVKSAVEMTGASADRVVMLGDTPYDVTAARRAGVTIVGVRCGGWDDDDLSGAVAVYDDPADLLRHYDESVFG